MFVFHLTNAISYQEIPHELFEQANWFIRVVQSMNMYQSSHFVGKICPKIDS